MACEPKPPAATVRPLRPMPDRATIPRRLALAAWTLFLAAFCGAFVFGIVPTTIPSLHFLLLAAVIVLWDERHMLTLFAWVSPFLLANVALRSNQYVIEVGLGMMLLMDAARRLLAPARALALEPAVRAPASPWRTLAWIGAIGFAAVSLGAAVGQWRFFWEGWSGRPPSDRYNVVGDFVVAAYLREVHGGEAIRQAAALLIGLGVAEFVARRLDAEFLRQLVWSFGGALCLTTFLGLAEYVKLADLLPYRTLPLDYVLGERRLMAFALHPGWYAQHWAMTFPFLILAWRELHHRGRRGAIVAAGLLVLAAILTRQRALWLIVMILAAAGAAYAAWKWRRGAGAGWWREHRGFLLKVAGALALSLVAIDWLSDGLLRSRLENLLRYQDRLYYYYSTFGLLGLAPWGVGLGAHHYAYEAVFIPLADYWQTDHVTPHSLWLHLLVERGPFAPLCFAAIVFGALGHAWRTRRRLDPRAKAAGASFAVGLAAILLYGFVQELFYIRAIELILYVYVGALLGLRPFAKSAEGVALAADSATSGAVSASRRGMTDGRWALAAVVAAALGAATAWGQIDITRRLCFDALWPDRWMGSQGTLLVPGVTARVEFNLFVHGADKAKTIEIRVDGETVRTLQMGPGALEAVRLEFAPLFRGPMWRAYRRVDIAASSVAEPEALAPGEKRRLGALMMGLQAFRE